MDTTLCPYCGNKLTPGKPFCTSCGKKLPPTDGGDTTPDTSVNATEGGNITCPNCGAIMPPGKVYCTNCGTKLDEPLDDTATNIFRVGKWFCILASITLAVLTTLRLLSIL